jgi:hypothetical protein
VLDVTLGTKFPGDKGMDMLSISLFGIKDFIRRYSFIAKDTHRRKR